VGGLLQKKKTAIATDLTAVKVEDDGVVVKGCRTDRQREN
jgi:hypothetical protein